MSTWTRSGCSPEAFARSISCSLLLELLDDRDDPATDAGEDRELLLDLDEPVRARCRHGMVGLEPGPTPRGGGGDPGQQRTFAGESA